ncbi:hypothetical protein DACRYDRAFT_17510 [Dacryopinax primogenitus]|uniref:EF-hand domain-containing protein n=1 Tax=Dacryopinax primogenitus (strain DJM 731) TaxID=1858805 RepID=M5FUY4_DACPD|nr:uncharacterized protein DACRYDRAFT_17510 [Dacryopinax primogenitus]EJT99354.1 hypothetical protein DACRYDRAFT_17510 [Dacryopinax primogenitus]
MNNNYDDPIEDDIDDMEEVQTDDLAALPQHLRDEIDHAFDRAARAVTGEEDDDSGRRRKRRKLNSGIPSPVEDMGGGFLVSEEPGGFLPSDEPTGSDPSKSHGSLLYRSPSFPSTSRQTHIPISLVSRALKLLRLPVDDDAVLATFREAATGWGERAGKAEEKGVSREDWRAVCAVLIGQREEGEMKRDDNDEEEDEEPEGEGGFMMDEEEESDLTDDEEDNYQPEDDEQGSSPSSDQGSEYEEAPASSSKPFKDKRKAKGKTRVRDQELELSELGYADLSVKKKQEVRDAFALFFEEEKGMKPKDLNGKGKQRETPPLITRRIGAADLAKVAKLLNEKLSAEEIEEMLEMFTSAADKTVGIQDFSKIMIRGNVL